MTLSRTATSRSNHSRHSIKSSHSHPKSHSQLQSQELPPVTKTESFEAAAAKASKGEDSGGPDPLLGFLNHLSPQQSEALTSFKLVLKEEQLYTEAHGGARASHDDSTMLYALPTSYYLSTMLVFFLYAKGRRWLWGIFVVLSGVVFSLKPLPGAVRERGGF